VRSTDLASGLALMAGAGSRRSVTYMPSEVRKPTIVVGYDGSDTSRAALAFAGRQAGPDGQVFIVHAYELPPEFLGSPYYQQMLSERRANAEALLRALPISGDEERSPHFEIELIGGSPAESIATVARARNADEIVIGARGVGRMHSLLGSVSHELLHIADRPVVVIPASVIKAAA
jgi:nucleotide-binding universal stress UspA family protein